MKRLLAILLAVLVLGTASAPTLAHGPDPILTGGLFAQNKVLQYRWTSSGTPPLDMKLAIHAARDDSNASRKSKSPSFDYDGGASNVVYYGADVPCGTNGLACFRRDTPDWFGLWFRPNGTRFDWGTLRWCELSGAPDGCYDAENIALDEFGHVLVLAHHANFSDASDYRDAVVQTFSRTKPRAAYNAHVFGRCDVAALQQAYDILTYSTLHSTCFDVPTVVTLAVSDSSVSSGSMVTFTATLTSAGDGRLSNNPMSGRTVVLQQRTSTGWTDVLTLAGTSTAGQYRGSLTARATHDYRSLFRGPSNEGAETDGSPAITVFVSSTCTGTCPQSSVSVR
ncbi:MAG TPA: hypothetical protein VKB30_11255 [Candidatus Limnocylindrales bacterium]|nr:hypothetical protein [Candidatus Limnocylindrales bacterium]